MKNLKCFIPLLFMLIFANISIAQSAFEVDGNAVMKNITGINSQIVSMEVYFAGTVDDATVLTSNPINIIGWDDNLTTNPPFFTGTLSGGTVSTQKITCDVYGSMEREGTYSVIDTLLSADSVLTVIERTANLNGKRYKYIVLKFYEATDNVATDFKFWLYFYKRDPT